MNPLKFFFEPPDLRFQFTQPTKSLKKSRLTIKITKIAQINKTDYQWFISLIGPIKFH